MVAESFWLPVISPICVGVALSFLVEGLLRPCPADWWKRPPAALAIHVAVWLLFFVVEFVVFRRPWFAAANVLALLLAMVQVSNAKFFLLREPFVVQDVDYFIDALKHPRLYFPFLGLGRAVAAVAGIVTALIAGLSLETPMTETLAAEDFFIGLVGVAILAAGLLLLAHGRIPAMSYDPSADLRRFGLIACLWCYAADERRFPASLAAQSPFIIDGGDIRQELPDLIVVQSESFFDIRRLFAGIRSELLAEFDALKAASICHGSLTVPVWGANTVRTEFAFLSGLDPEALGVHRFNPYRRLVRQGTPTLAGYLKKLGYRTVCVHPYPATFYGRSKVYPLLGFDEFIDIHSFADAEKPGPYVGDLMVAEKIGGLLDKDGERPPLFIFAITMENHGPLHLERIQAGDETRLYSAQPPSGCDELTVYLRHLVNADRMIGMLRRGLEASARPGGLCFFGDHVPIMTQGYTAIGSPDGDTDYVIWRKAVGHGGLPSALKVEDLGRALLEAMGLWSNPAPTTGTHLEE